jgi:ABC-type sugar transport systems, permease components
MQKSLFKIKKSTLLLLLAPGVLIYLFVVVVPLFNSLIYSFTDWTIGPNKNFIGLENYQTLIQDKVFWQSLWHNLFIVFFNVTVQMAIAFILTVLYTSKATKFQGFHRTVIFLPVVLSAVVVGYIWQMIYSGNYGILNAILQFLGLESWIQPWLDSPKIVLGAVTVPLIWQYLGVPLIIFMSAVQGIPKDIYEVCELDGVTGVQKAVHITFPLIVDSIKVTIMLSISSNMLVFTHIYVLTGGGPGTSSMVLAQYAYNTSFHSMKLGYGSTISIAIFIVSMAIVLLFRRLTRGKDE